MILVVLFAPTQLFAEETKRDDGFYGSFSGMVSVMGDSNLEANGNDAGEIELDTGFGFAIALGKKFGDGLRGEIEYSQRTHEVNDIENEYAHTYSALFNVVYDMENGSQITPYFGIGLGVGWMETADGYELAHQFLTGVNFEVTERADLVLGYRYAEMTDVDRDEEGVSLSSSVASHNFELGVRFAF